MTMDKGVTMEFIRPDAVTTDLVRQILLINSAILAQNRLILEVYLNPKIRLRPTGTVPDPAVSAPESKTSKKK